MVAPGFDEFAVLRIFDDAVVGLRYRKIAVAVGDEDVAIRGDENIRRAVELIGSIAGDVRPAQRHQQVAVRSELRNGLVLAVGNPDRSIGSCEQSVRPLEQAGAEAHFQAAGCVEFLNRRDVRAFAGFSAAAIEDPKTGAVAIDVDADCLPPNSSVRKRRPVLDDMVRVKSAVGILSLNPPPARRNARKYGHGGRKPKHCSRVVTHGILPSLSLARLRRRSHWR